MGLRVELRDEARGLTRCRKIVALYLDVRREKVKNEKFY
jgi:hypothetical protein